MKTLRHAAIPDTGHCGPAVHAVLPAAPIAVGLARALTKEILAGWALQPLVDDACLVVSELATNAVREGARRGDRTVLVQLCRAHGSIVIQVGDHNPQPPPQRATDPVTDGLCHGRGLRIVFELSVAAGWYRQDGWKIVWAQIGAAHAAGPAADVESSRHLLETAA